MDFGKYMVAVTKVQDFILAVENKQTEILSDYTRTNNYHMEQLEKLKTESVNDVKSLFDDMTVQLEKDAKATRPEQNGVGWEEKSYYASIVGQEIEGMSPEDMLAYFDEVIGLENQVKRNEASRLIGHRLRQNHPTHLSDFSRKDYQTMPAAELEHKATTAAVESLGSGIPTIRVFAEGILSDTLAGAQHIEIDTIGKAFGEVLSRAESEYRTIKAYQA